MVERCKDFVRFRRINERPMQDFCQRKLDYIRVRDVKCLVAGDTDKCPIRPAVGRRINFN